LTNHINVLIDDYADMDLRSKMVINGIHESAYQKKIPIRTFFSIDTLIKTLEKESRRYVIVISESKLHSEKLLSFINEKDIHPIFINMQFSNTSYFFSSVIPNYYSATYHLSKVILDEFTEPSAFAGFNADSMADKFRLDGFLKAVEEYKVPSSVFSNRGDVDQCISDTLADIGQYRNIICANDVIALLLLKKMKESGLETADYNITGYGNMKIGEYFKPSLTTMMGDYYNAGILAVDIYVFLNKKKLIQNLCVNMDSKIIIRESTHITNKKFEPKPMPHVEGELVVFYGNKSVNKIDRLERMLVNCDETDIGILHAIMDNKTYEEIAEIHFLAVNTVKYRIKKMEGHMEVKNRSELMEQMRSFDISI
jgi:DNA-binding LacI/PurR family transcriptional regulator